MIYIFKSVIYHDLPLSKVWFIMIYLFKSVIYHDLPL